MTPTPFKLLKTLMNTVIDSEVLDRVASRLQRKPVEENPMEKNLSRTNKKENLEQLRGGHDNYREELYRGNIENYVGLLQVPVGIVGPLRVNGVYANGDFQVPLATTEGALIASYNRGAKVIGISGGATVICTADAISRAPGFVFGSIVESSRFIAWCAEHVEQFKAIAMQATQHGRLQDVQPTHDGNYAYLHFQYHTGDAAGQNMVTIATDLICQFIVEQCPIKPKRWYIDGNMSGDKKATAMSHLLGRGKKVLAEVVIPQKLVRRALHVSPQDMVDYSTMAMYGGIHSGSIGVNGHFANALAAFYLACGQDVACVAESAIGTSRAEVTPDGDLYVCISMPNVVVGSVGGGTHLPTQRECLELMDCFGNDKAKKLAEICGALALAGEISIAAAMAAGHFTQAHKTYGRKPKKKNSLEEYCCDI